MDDGGGLVSHFFNAAATIAGTMPARFIFAQTRLFEIVAVCCIKRRNISHDDLITGPAERFEQITVSANERFFLGPAPAFNLKFAAARI